MMAPNQSSENLVRNAGEVVGAPRFELGTSWSRTKRATRLRYAPEKQVSGVGCQVSVET